MPSAQSIRRSAAVGVASVAAVALTATAVPAASTVRTASVSNGAQLAAAQADSKAGSMDSRVRGEFGKNGTVRGTFEPKRFVMKKERVFAVGKLRAVMRRGNGDLVGRTTKMVTLPVRGSDAPSSTAAQQRGGSCDILNLVLGPLDLDLLGLEVHLNRVVLDIIATPGPGKLLGNLLCAVAGLLDGSGGLSLLERLRLANLLNRILTILRA